MSALHYTIRLKVLDLAIDPIPTALFLSSRRTGRVFKFPVPAIAKAFNLQNRNECLLVLLEKSTLEIHSGPGLMRTMGFLQSIDFNEAPRKETSYNLGFDCVRSLRFPYFSRFPHHSLPAGAFNKDIQLMRMCKNLTKVSMTWVDEELLGPGDGNGQRYAPKPLEQLRKEYRLDLMFGLKNLKELHIALKDTERVWSKVGDMGTDQANMLKMWFGQEFFKRGRSVMVWGW